MIAVIVVKYLKNKEKLIEQSFFEEKSKLNMCSKSGFIVHFIFFKHYFLC